MKKHTKKKEKTGSSVKTAQGGRGKNLLTHGKKEKGGRTENEQKKNTRGKDPKREEQGGLVTHIRSSGCQKRPSIIKEREGTKPKNSVKGLTNRCGEPEKTTFTRQLVAAIKKRSSNAWKSRVNSHIRGENGLIV